MASSSPYLDWTPLRMAGSGTEDRDALRRIVEILARFGPHDQRRILRCAEEQLAPLPATGWYPASSLTDLTAEGDGKNA